MDSANLPVLSIHFVIQSHRSCLTKISFPFRFRTNVSLLNDRPSDNHSLFTWILKIYWILWCILWTILCARISFILTSNFFHLHDHKIRLVFSDHETASSAVRNLNNYEVGGRPLRIDLADSDPFLEGKTTVRGELLDGGGPSDRQWRSDNTNKSQDFLASLPPGIPVPAGSTVLDTISQTLATMNPSQLMDVLAHMKVCLNALV